MNKVLPAKLKGTVTAFSGYGRRLGYPTANIATKTYLKDGVYFGYATLDDYKNNPALIFIGQPITVGDSIRRVEAHLLDVPDKDYYGKDLNLQIEYFHRNNAKFNSIDDLIIAMKNDEKSARIWFK
ncbi:MAG: riboflavin kinase / adenylyltransferase [Patescibacteria group bacterium]|nr:riboflavin kinase / adenylyltransferase [Patescibacteria group bacterium]